MSLSSKFSYSLRHLKTITKCHHTRGWIAYSLLLPLFKTFLSLCPPGPVAVTIRNSRSFSSTSASGCRPIIVPRNCLFYLLSFQLQFLIDKSFLTLGFLLLPRCKWALKNKYHETKCLLLHNASICDRPFQLERASWPQIIIRHGSRRTCRSSFQPVITARNSANHVPLSQLSAPLPTTLEISFLLTALPQNRPPRRVVHDISL